MLHIFHIFLYHTRPSGITELVSLIANIVTILGIFGLILAYIEYQSRLRETKKVKIRETLNAITSIKSQLVTIGFWTGYEIGGYAQKDMAEWTQNNYLERINPFHKIYEVDYSYLKNISTLPGVEEFSEATNQALAWVIQWSSNFNSFLEEIEIFKYSQSAEKNTLLNQKFSLAQTKQGLHASLNTEEKLFTDALLSMYITLHFTIISDGSGQSLHFWHKRLLDLLNQLEKTKKKELKDLY